jgi:hypothetical protein
LVLLAPGAGSVNAGPAAAGAPPADAGTPGAMSAPTKP